MRRCPFFVRVANGTKAIDSVQREKYVLGRWVAKPTQPLDVGQTNPEIGAQLYVSEKTGSVHVSNILRKLGVSTRVDAAAVEQPLAMR